MSDYYEDEYYEDCEPEVSATSFSSYLCKAANGHLFVEEVYGWKYSGQDWGETVGQWVTTRIRIRELADELQPVALKIGRDLKPGEQIPCYLWDELEAAQDDIEPELVEVDEIWVVFESDEIEPGFSTHSFDGDIPF